MQSDHERDLRAHELAARLSAMTHERALEREDVDDRGNRIRVREIASAPTMVECARELGLRVLPAGSPNLPGTALHLPSYEVIVLVEDR